MLDRYSACGITVEHRGGWLRYGARGVRYVSQSDSLITRTPVVEDHYRITTTTDADGWSKEEKRLVASYASVRVDVSTIRCSVAVDTIPTMAVFDDGGEAPTGIDGTGTHSDNGMRIGVVDVKIPLIRKVSVAIDGDGYVHGVIGPRGIFVRTVVNRLLARARRVAARDDRDMEDFVSAMGPGGSLRENPERAEIAGLVVRTGGRMAMRTHEGEMPVPDGLSASEGDLLILAGRRWADGVESHAIRNLATHEWWCARMDGPRLPFKAGAAMCVAIAAAVAGLATAATPLLIGAVFAGAFAYAWTFRDEPRNATRKSHSDRVSDAKRRIRRIIHHNARARGYAGPGSERDNGQ